MSFMKGFALVLELEGGYQESHLPQDALTFAGITEATWEWYCSQNQVQPHWPPSPAQVEQFYRQEYWDGRYCAELAEPADSVWLQCAINLPTIGGNIVLQNALMVVPDGDVGPVTRAEFKRVQPVDLAMRILVAQREHYSCGASPYKAALIARCDKVLKHLNAGEL